MTTKDNLFTIGEVAKAIGITRRIIINYEDHGLITADSRGEDDKGYRYYSMDTLVRIRTIRNFQDFGLSLDEIKEYLTEGKDLTLALKRLESLRDELNRNIEKIRERINTSSTPHILISELSSHTVYCKSMRDTSIETRTNKLRSTAYEAINIYGVNLSKQMYFLQYHMDDPDHVTYCATVPDNSIGENIIELPKSRAVIGYHHGSYDKLPAVREKLMEYAKNHNIPLAGTCRHIYLEGPPQHKDPNKFLTKVALMIEE